MSGYDKPPGGAGLRLHLNENTAGCSPKVMAVLQAMTREQTAFYPDYDSAIDACAARFQIRPENLILTNGLDDGIMLVSIAAMRAAGANPFEAIVVEPAFDMYATCIDAIGGKVVDVLPRPGFAFPLDEILAAITAATRAIFLTNPNNPTGISISSDTVLAIAKAAPHALVLLDEAYADFSGETMVPDAVSGRAPNLVIGRTFAKAYGLAGLRAGALMGLRSTLDPMRRAVLPYTLNAFAAAALPAAFADVEYYDWYLSEVRTSKTMIYEMLERAGIEFWRSDGNFVLASFGERLPAVIAGLGERGVIIRDRSHDPGCVGCARITAGVVEHTRTLVAALGEVLCVAR